MSEKIFAKILIANRGEIVTCVMRAATELGKRTIDTAGFVFIGPKADSMRLLGDKASARRVAMTAGVPVIPATEVLDDNFDPIKK